MASEEIDRAVAREHSAQRARAEQHEVIVRTVDDIKRVVSDFAPQARCNIHQPTVGLVTKMEGRDERDQPALFQVTAETQSKSRRDLLIEAFTIIRDRRIALEKAQMASQMPLTVNGRSMVPSMPLADDMVHNVDSMIRMWFGGARRGERIVWQLSDGLYQYDIFSHKVTLTHA